MIRDIEKILTLVIPEPNSGCWLWLGGVVGEDYPYYNHEYVYRTLYKYYKGKIPTGYELDHLCSITLCVNPDHVEPVTHTENCRRTAERGRAKGGIGYINMSKFDLAVRNDIELLRNNNLTISQIAEIVPVSRASICRILRGNQ